MTHNCLVGSESKMVLNAFFGLFFLASVISEVNTASFGFRSLRFLIEIQKYFSYDAFPKVL